MVEMEHAQHELDPALIRSGRLEKRRIYLTKKNNKNLYFILDFVVDLLMI